MADVTNFSTGARGVNVKKGEAITTRWLEPGETLELGDGETVHGDLPDLGKPQDDSASADEIARLKARIAELEANSQPSKPALTGKNKEQLLAIAESEGVTQAVNGDGAEIAIADGTNQQIMDAITAARG